MPPINHPASGKQLVLLLKVAIDKMGSNPGDPTDARRPSISAARDFFRSPQRTEEIGDVLSIFDGNGGHRAVIEIQVERLVTDPQVSAEVSDGGRWCPESGSTPAPRPLRSSVARAA